MPKKMHANMRPPVFLVNYEFNSKIKKALARRAFFVISLDLIDLTSLRHPKLEQQLALKV